MELVLEEEYNKIIEQNTHHIEKLEQLVRKYAIHINRLRFVGNYMYDHRSYNRNKDLIPKQLNLFSLARKCDRILEIGFNAGHSCLIMLLANPNCKIVAFDLMTNPYVMPCYEYMREEFPNRLLVLRGNSNNELPRYIKENQGAKFDLFHIDGGHARDVANKDFINCRKMSHDSSYIVWDDMQIKVLNDLWKSYISENKVKDEGSNFLQCKKYPHAIGILKK